MRQFDISVAVICESYLNAVCGGKKGLLNWQYDSSGGSRIEMRKDGSSGIEGTVVVDGKKVRFEGLIPESMQKYIGERVAKLF